MSLQFFFFLVERMLLFYFFKFLVFVIKKNIVLLFKDNYLQSRAATMQNIESTVVELGGIFQQLAHMVKEQDEMVERYVFYLLHSTKVERLF